MRFLLITLLIVLFVGCTPVVPPDSPSIPCPCPDCEVCPEKPSESEVCPEKPSESKIGPGDREAIEAYAPPKDVENDYIRWHDWMHVFAPQFLPKCKGCEKGAPCQWGEKCACHGVE